MQVTFSPSSVYPLSCECSACFVGASDLVFYAQFLIPFPYFLEDIHSFNTYYIISVQAFSRCPLPIPCSTFNSDGSIFAYAVSPKRYHISHRVFDQLSFEIYLLLV